MAKGIIIGAPSSGSGKTFLTLGLLRLLKIKQVSVRSAKVGPDYIDPAFHTAASGSECLNLDTWAMRDTMMDYLLSSLEQQVDFIVVEGVMGLFDGVWIKNQAKNGSTASLAEKTGWPIVLVVDASSQAQSIAALINGFAYHSTKISLSGVIFNKVGGLGHEKILRETALKYFPDIDVLGCVPRNEKLVLPERHLGLVQASEHKSLDSFLDNVANWLVKYLEIDKLLAIAKHREEILLQKPFNQIIPIGQRIALAKDVAFSFVYPSLLEGWAKAGSEIVPFSPLAGQGPCKSADAIYLPGGYPELYAGKLSSNGFLKLLRVAAASGAKIFGECGGYMVLGNSLIDKDGGQHEMAGLLNLETSFKDCKLQLGYRRVTAQHDFLLGKRGSKFSGHEFHYATSDSREGSESLFSSFNARGEDLGFSGAINGNVSGSFVHLIDQLNF